ncbi:hypothetical protein [uncultured Desulfovibrio sp.]|uniref:hypothetical protein n=1 Tax=uncultured Desulfovibrio sp. TaxID=167968 RepID=UPI0026038AD7|nr:hypothetical protein [uncultured Desulfovibrio sp.]
MSCRIIRFPALRGPMPGVGEQLSAPWAVRLWPGLPASCGEPAAAAATRGVLPSTTTAPRGPWWHPKTYPWTEEQAARCLEELRRLADAALAGCPVESLSVGQARDGRLQDEARLRDAFARGGDEAARAAAEAAEQEREARQAQRLLIWCWLQEERVAELAALSAACTGADGAIGAALGLDADEGLEALPPEMRAPLAVDTGLLPDWRRVLHAALPFLPEDAALLAEGAMCEDLRDALANEITPLATATDPGARTLRDAAGDDTARLGLLRQPVWRLLGRPRALSCCPQWSREPYVLLPLPEARHD